MMGLLRAPLLEAGAELASSGDFDQSDDVMFLSLGELKALSADPAHDWKPLIRERRASYEREKLRRQLPRLFLSDGRAFYEGIANPDPSGASLSGSPVSPGTAEGLVRVVLDPRNAGMRPGEILVCPGTDPSWTPLFLSAGGLIMEMGGMMTHGAVVAREYGIPAIVGLDQATRRLMTGQRIRMDGSTGRVDLLDSGPESPSEKEPSAP
jgi:pyruvate,water dikinase